MKYFILYPVSPKLRALRRKPRTLIKSIANEGRKLGKDLVMAEEYTPADRMILYGWGGQLQQQCIRRHSGDYVAFDLGYWLRDGFFERKWRVSINGFHCPERIMAGPTPSDERMVREKIYVHDDARKGSDRILLVGTAPKSQRVGANGWTAKMSQQLRKQFPNSTIVYRPKPERPAEKGVVYHELSRGGTIEQAIARCGLVVCRHSNVAVDACRLGIPVVCEDGAASAIYPGKLSHWEDQPNKELRRDFLTRLSWWQWSIREVQKGGFWEWLENELENS